MRHVVSPWEKIFSRRLAPVLSGLSSSGGNLLTQFHTDVEVRAVKNGASIAAFQMLKQQLPVYKETLKDAAGTVKNEVTAKQRDINREFVPKIAENMLSVYNDCLRETGPGQYNRMKGYMDRHVENAKQTMYQQSAEAVKGKLTQMLKESKKSLMDKTDEIFLSVKRDYTGVIVGDEGNQAQLLPRDQRLLRKAILQIVDGAELRFKRAVGLEPEEEPEPAVEDSGVAVGDEILSGSADLPETSAPSWESAEDDHKMTTMDTKVDTANHAATPATDPTRGLGLDNAGLTDIMSAGLASTLARSESVLPTQLAMPATVDVETRAVSAPIASTTVLGADAAPAGDEVVADEGNESDWHLYTDSECEVPTRATVFTGADKQNAMKAFDDDEAPDAVSPEVNFFDPYTSPKLGLRSDKENHARASETPDADTPSSSWGFN